MPFYVFWKLWFKFNFLFDLFKKIIIYLWLFLKQILGASVFSENEVFSKWYISESSSTQLRLSLSVLILYSSKGHLIKMCHRICYFFLKFSKQTCSNLTETWINIPINFVHFWYSSIFSVSLFSENKVFFKWNISDFSSRQLYQSFLEANWYFTFQKVMI